MDNIAIWGAGTYCEKILQLFPINMKCVTVFVDKDPKKWGRDFFGKEIVPPDQLKTFQVDCVVIAVQSEDIFISIRKELEEYNVLHINEYCKKEIENTSCFLNQKWVLDCEKQSDVNFLDSYFDFIVQWFNVDKMIDRGLYIGSIPESIYLFNKYPEFRRLKDVFAQKNRLSKIKDLSRLSSFVLNINRILEGYFPDSLTEDAKRETYAFVSLDCDLYAPTKEGLEFFWPRLNRGGMIFVHDYSGCFFEGCCKAVDEFLRKENLNIVLLPDKAGTAVLVK